MSQDTHDYRTSYWLIAALVAVLVLVFGGIASVNEFRKPLANKDYPIWYQAGVDAMAGDDIYAIHLGDEMNFTYPPFGAVLVFGPLSLLGNHAFVIALVFIQTVAWIAAILLSVKLTTGRARGAHPLLYLLPMLVTVGGVWTCYQLGQSNLALLALMLGGFVLLNHGLELGKQLGQPSDSSDGWFTRHRWSFSALAGLLFATAASFKAFPVLIVIYLVYRRHWVALSSFVFGLALLLLILPAVIRGPSLAWSDLAYWTNNVLLTSNEGQIGQRHKGWAYGKENQSLQATVIRLTHDVTFHRTESGHGETLNLLDLSFDNARRLFFVIGGLIMVGQILFMLPKRKNVRETRVIEQAMVTCLIPIGSPLALGYAMVWMLFPLTVALHYIGELPDGRRRVAWLVGWFAVALLPLVSMNVPMIRHIHAAGTGTWAMVALWAGLGCWLLIVRKRMADKQALS